jgi:hypothetical protein
MSPFPSPFSFSKEDFAPDLNLMGNKDLMGIPVLDITKEFFSILDPQPEPHRKSIPDP